MINIAVCDDDASFARFLATQIRELWAIKIPDSVALGDLAVFSGAAALGSYADGDKALNIVFLDIDMPDKDGFAAASELKVRFPDVVIIFVSSYENYVYSSFEYSPFRFLRKSHLGEELPKALVQAVEKCMLDGRVISFDTTEGEQLVRLRDILYIESQKNYYIIREIAGHVVKCRGTMSEAEAKLEGGDMFRVHSGYLVNMANVASIKNATEVRMISGECLPIARGRFAEFRDAYMKFTRRRIGV